MISPTLRVALASNRLLLAFEFPIFSSSIIAFPAAIALMLCLSLAIQFTPFLPQTVLAVSAFLPLSILIVLRPSFLLSHLLIRTNFHRPDLIHLPPHPSFLPWSHLPEPISPQLLRGLPPPAASAPSRAPRSFR